MTKIFNFRGFRGLAVAAACVMIAVPAAALAQPYDDNGGYDSQRARDDAQRAQYDSARRDYNSRYGDGAYERYYPDPDAQTRAACHDEKKSNEVGGAILGGIAGAVLGSNVARGGGREGGAIIGGVGGAAVGADIAKNATHCQTGR